MAERNTDTVPAMLTPGEFVITDKAVENAGGPGFFYWLMNMLDPSSKKAREDGYSHGGTVSDSLLSRMQEGGFTIPAGKNIFGQPTEEMGPEELMEMIMPGGGAKATLQMGKGGIKAILSSNKEDILKSLAKMRKTGKGSKEIAEAVDWQTELQKYLKQATSRRFTNPIKKQRGGNVDKFDPESSRFDMKTALESGAVRDKEGHMGSLDPRTGMVLKGRGHKTWDEMALAEIGLGNSIEFNEEMGRYYSIPSGMYESALPDKTAVNINKYKRGGSIDDYSLMDYMMPAMDKRLGTPLKKFQFGGYATDYQGNPVGPQTTGSGGYTSPSQYQYGPTSQTYGAQSAGMGGLPASGSGGLPTSPTGFGGGTTGTAQSTLGSALATASAYTPPPSAQSQLIQPSNIYSTGIGSIFEEMNLQTPGSEYLENIQAYDPKQQRRMQQDLGRKMPGIGGTGASGFAGQTGAEIRESGKQREAVTEQYTRGSEDLRKQYREQIMQDVLADMSAGTYEFEDLG